MRASWYWVVDMLDKLAIFSYDWQGLLLKDVGLSHGGRVLHRQ